MTDLLILDPSLWMFLLFFVFFVIGYESDKASGGFFMLFAGFALIGLGVLIRADLLYINFLTTPFGFLICMLGGMKAFFQVEEIQDKTGRTVRRYRRR